MSNLYGVGCAKCNAEVAAALRDMPDMDGYLDTDGYWQRYGQCANDAGRPRPFLDGEEQSYVTTCVPGEDGWLVRYHTGLRGAELCINDPENVALEVWRGKVEIRSRESE